MKLLEFVKVSDGKTLTELYWNRKFGPLCNPSDAYKGEQILKLQLRSSKSNIQNDFYIKTCKNQRFFTKYWKDFVFFINSPIKKKISNQTVMNTVKKECFLVSINSTLVHNSS